MKALVKLVSVAAITAALSTAAVAAPDNQNGCEASGNRPKKCDTVSVPEPVTLGLLGLGLAGIALARRRRK